ncbi:MAG: hypothetical protein WC773_03420 [Patescibacteria group bacterium]|jgi:hypothetical protein
MSLFHIATAHAQNLGYSANFSPLQPLTGNYTFSALVDIIIGDILFIAGALAVIYLLIAGIQYITAGGDEAKAGKARQGIVNAVIGIIVIVLAFVIEKTVARMFM